MPYFCFQSIRPNHILKRLYVHVIYYINDVGLHKLFPINLTLTGHPVTSRVMTLLMLKSYVILWP